MNMAYFSSGSLQRIQEALDAVPAGNSYFSVQLSHVDIRAHFGWGEGIEIRCENDRYICIRHLERATKREEIPDEEQAVALFTRIACHAKKEIINT